MEKWSKRKFQKVKTRSILRNTQLTLFLTLFFVMQLSASVYSQGTKMNISEHNQSLIEVFEQIRSKSAYTFVYDLQDVENVQNINLSKKDATLDEILYDCLENTNLSYTIVDKTVIIKRAKENQQDEQKDKKPHTITGTVFDEDGNPIPGVSIVLKGTNIGVATDIQGKYTLEFQQDKVEIEYSFIGMTPQTILYKGQQFLNVTMQEDKQLLDEVVVTGYQKLNVNEAAGSFNTVNMETFNKKISPNISSTLEGLSPSLVVATDPSSNEKKLTIRGISTLESSSEPLIIVDGFPYSGGLNSINSYDIESITLLKDAASASIYGAKSANGVVVITTKRGKSGGMEIRYSSNTQVGEKPDIDYFMNRVSSSDMVAIEKNYFEKNEKNLHSYQNFLEQGSPYAKYHVYPFSKAIKFLLDHKEGRMTKEELDTQLNNLRNADNKNDLANLLLQTPIYTEHNFELGYGTENLKIRSSLNYHNNKTGFKGHNSEGVKYSLNSLLDVSERFRLDLSANFNIGRTESYKDSPQSLLQLSPYEHFYDKKGNALPVTLASYRLGTNNNGIFGGKDSYEIERLKDLGLLDETYYPGSDYGLSTESSKNWSAYFKAQMRLNILDGLDGVLGFNIGKINNTRKVITDKNSWEMKSFVNNLTRISDSGEKGELLIPLGSRIKETRQETTNYLLRGQLEYDKTLNENHKIMALLGTEVQSNKKVGTIVDRVGYDDRSNTFKPVNYRSLSESLSGLFIPEGNIAGGIRFENDFIEKEDRYVSFYANSNYIYANKYVLSGSIRIDKSNLFGTDPKYRFKPLWSVGGKWRIAEEDFFKSKLFSKLDLQLSYGINGNISNDYGPYDLATSTFADLANYANALTILSYSSPDLRWEQTKTFNIGVHTNLLKDRIAFTFDYYRKHSQDVLADAEIDPTLGTTYVKRNDATIANDGYEVSLRTLNIKKTNFNWSTYLGLTFNKSKVEEIYQKDELAYHSAGRLKNRAGYAPNSLFVFDWAGVDAEGNGQIKLNNGKVISVSPSIYEGGIFDVQGLEYKDLVWGGTTLPKLVANITNNLIYKNFSLSFMFVYQGGHVLLRDSYDGSVIGSFPGVANAEAAYAWKEKGDENNKNTVPRLGSTTYYGVIKNSTKNIIDGDFIRLRDIVLSYTLPKKILDKIGLNEVTFNLKGNNLYLWTKNSYDIDPESQGLGYRNYPTTKSVSLGVNIIF